MLTSTLGEAAALLPPPHFSLMPPTLTSQKLSKDPVKNVRPACGVCGRTGHSESSCFHNEKATCPVAIARAPFGTPL